MSGRVDDGADRRGAVTAGRITVSWDRGADPHTWTWTSALGVPPYREQTELLSDDSASSADATTALPTGSSVNDGGVGCSAMLLATGGVAVEQLGRGRCNLHGRLQLCRLPNKQ